MEECTFITKLTSFKFQWTIVENKGKGNSYLWDYYFLRNVNVLDLSNLKWEKNG